MPKLNIIQCTELWISWCSHLYFQILYFRERLILYICVFSLYIQRSMSCLNRNWTIEVRYKWQYQQRRLSKYKPGWCNVIDNLTFSINVLLPQVGFTLTLKLLLTKVALSVPMALSSPMIKHLERWQEIAKLVR